MKRAPNAPSPAALQQLLDRAVELERLNALDAAEHLYREALSYSPDDIQILQRLGAVLAARWSDDDEGAAAIEILERAAAQYRAVTPETAGVFNNLGNALRRAGRYEEAEAVLRRVTDALPDYWQAWHNLGQVYKSASRFDQAAAALRRSIAIEPMFAANHGVLGEVLTKLGRINAATVSFRRAIDLGYRDADVLSHLAICHRHLGELDRAEVLLREVVAMTPDNASANTNLAVVLAQQGQFEEAAVYHNRAIEIDADHVLNRTNRAYARLAAGDIPGGWDDWERAIENGPRGKERIFPEPVRKWQGEDVSGERLMVYREQGVGDEMLFASCYPDAAAQCAHLTVETDPRLATLFARSFPYATVRRQTLDGLGRETLSDADRDFDVVTPAGSLPRILRKTLADFPAQPSYLVADPTRVAAWRDRLAAIAGPRVGISWRSKINTAERRLEYTRLTEWAPIFGVAGVSFFSLQYDDCERDLCDAETRFGVDIHRWPDVDYMNDFEEVAALTANLDLVLAPRNAVAMLSGALGVPTVMMGNRWDWSDLGTDTCPWIPAISLVYRELGQEWDAVLAAAAQRVHALVASSSSLKLPH